MSAAQRGDSTVVDDWRGVMSEVTYAATRRLDRLVAAYLAASAQHYGDALTISEPLVELECRADCSSLSGQSSPMR